MAISNIAPQCKCLTLFLSIIVFASNQLQAQSPIDSVIGNLNPQKWAASIEQKSSRIEANIAAKSTKVLHKLHRHERRLWSKMTKGRDSVIAKAKLTEIEDKYGAMKVKLTKTSNLSGPYIAKLDSLSNSLKFLEQSGVGGKVKDAIKTTKSLQVKFNQAEEIRSFIRQRREQLRQQLAKVGLVKRLKKINKQVYYYSAYLQEYKSLLKDSKKIERKALGLLSKTKLFKDFMRRNSQLASMFRLPGDPGDPSIQPNLAGLQTRAQVNSLIQQQIAIGGATAQQQFRDNIQVAQSQLLQLKEKALHAGNGNSDAEAPDFKPNNQKTKSFLRRLEYGTNIQSQKATNFFPVTTDIGLSVGYKINDNSIIGIGGSYKMGWGKGWNNMSITHQGISFRSFVDVKVKKLLWITGGYEKNYFSEFERISQLQGRSGWQQSGLIGASKVIPVKMKFFKRTKIQLLWDFLATKTSNTTRPLIFRMGYNF